MQGVGALSQGSALHNPSTDSFSKTSKTFRLSEPFGRDLRGMAANKPRCEAQKVSGGGARKAGGAVRGGHSLAAVCHERRAKVLEKLWRCMECCGWAERFARGKESGR